MTVGSRGLPRRLRRRLERDVAKYLKKRRSHMIVFMAMSHSTTVADRVDNDAVTTHVSQPESNMPQDINAQFAKVFDHMIDNLVEDGILPDNFIPVMKDYLLQGLDKAAGMYLSMREAGADTWQEACKPLATEPFDFNAAQMDILNTYQKVGFYTDCSADIENGELGDSAAQVFDNMGINGEALSDSSQDPLRVASQCVFQDAESLLGSDMMNSPEVAFAVVNSKLTLEGLYNASQENPTDLSAELKPIITQALGDIIPRYLQLTNEEDQIQAMNYIAKRFLLQMPTVILEFQAQGLIVEDDARTMGNLMLFANIAWAVQVQTQLDTNETSRNNIAIGNNLLNELVNCTDYQNLGGLNLVIGPRIGLEDPNNNIRDHFYHTLILWHWQFIKFLFEIQFQCSDDPNLPYGPELQTFSNAPMNEAFANLYILVWPTIFGAEEGQTRWTGRMLALATMPEFYDCGGYCAETTERNCWDLIQNALDD